MADDKALSLNNGLPAIRNWAKEKFVGKETGKGLSDNNYSDADKRSWMILHLEPKLTCKLIGMSMTLPVLLISRENPNPCQQMAVMLPR